MQAHTDCHPLGDTRMQTARSAATGRTHACECTCTRPAYPPRTCACPHAGRQRRYLSRHTHAHRGVRATHVPPIPASAVTCTGRRSPCPAGRGACAARHGGRSRSPAPGPAPAARSAAGRWAGRSPLWKAARQPPRHPTRAPAAQSPILRAAAACLCPHLAPGRRGRCPGCPLRRGSHRSGGPSPARSGSARGCCTPERVTPSFSPQQVPTASTTTAPPTSPALTPCPWHLLWHCWSPSAETSWHRCWRHTYRGYGVSAPGETPPAPFLPRWYTPSRSRRQCQAAP